MDNIWCSNCSFRTIQQDTLLGTLAFVPIPENHPHIKLFANLQIINSPLDKNNKRIEDTCADYLGGKLK